MNRLKFSISLIILTAAIVAVSVYWLQSPTKPASTVGTSATEQQTISHVDIPVGTGELTGTVVLGSPTDTAIKINILANADMEAFVEYGISLLDQRSVTLRSSSGEPIVIELTGLRSDTSYTYRVQTKHADETAFSNGDDHTFHTQRATGSTFSFGIQGDSHPEREGKMFSSELYRITMHNVTAASPDLYFTLGDDFSIEKLISSDQVSGATVGQVYLDQRPYLDIIGADASLFLINGNHEQAAKYLLDGTANSPAVFAALARTTYFPLPTPGLFYSGDSEQVPDIGYLSDYYSFTWGGALFVVIDPYWHSAAVVDNTAGSTAADGKGKGARDLWDVTLGDTQYHWLEQTLEQSSSQYKFVFTHHVLGTGRGGIEEASLYEWGGYNTKGIWEFDGKRPGWDLPIHQLMVKTGVTIFFQGHDHLFARQELDGVIYQSVPNPADDTYTAFNQDAYTSGDTLPNSGFLNVTVAPKQVQVDYIRSYLPQDEIDQARNGSAAFTYTVK